MLANTISSTSPPTQEIRKFLTFHLCQDTEVMVGVELVLSTLQVPREQIIVIPDMPTWVMGVYNWRGEILWIIDLAQQLDLVDSITVSPSRLKSILILQINDLRMGMAVEQVHDILSSPLRAITSVSTVTAPQALASVVEGSLQHGERAILLLRIQAIYQRMWDQVLSHRSTRQL